MATASGRDLKVPQPVYGRLIDARKVVDTAVAGDAPVYGLNTGLGANLGHRIAPADIPAFQRQIIAGRAVAVGKLLPAQTGRLILLARLIGAAQGYSGISVPVFDHLCAVFRAGLSPGVPQHGSIGASDLTQNATWAMAILGAGQMWDGTAWRGSDVALAGAGLAPPALQPKDAMALINHSATSVALSGSALNNARLALRMIQHAAVLSLEGFAANGDIFAPDINTLRGSPRQSEMAAWFRAKTVFHSTPNRVQDALSFRTLAPVMGAADAALHNAIDIWQAELNGSSDSPAVIGTDAMRSTANFHSPALALALENASLAMAMVGTGSVMRIQRLMNPELTGLAKYLSPIGGASAGFVPLQKTAASVLADVRRHAIPVAFDPAPVSDGVEDMAPMTAQAATKLAAQMGAAQLLAGMEAIVAAQARDLRGTSPTPLHTALRAKIDMLQEDRALNGDVDAACAVLAGWAMR